MMIIIDKFDGPYGFLSNFSKSPIVYHGKHWPTAEHLYQSLKTADQNYQERIRLSSSPDEAKRMGRNVMLPIDWAKRKIVSMHLCVFLKFIQNRQLYKKLSLTKAAYLIEGNIWHDNEWGDCKCEHCRSISGKNLLGIILMKVRDELC